MTDRGDLLARLTTAVAHAPPATSLTDRLCVAFRDLAGASAAAFTVWYGEPHRITLAATHPSAARLEDLQDVIGEGPGHAAWTSGGIETGTVPDHESVSRWPVFIEAAADVLAQVVIRAVPMRPWERRFGVATLYQLAGPPTDLLLGDDQLTFRAEVERAVGVLMVTEDCGGPVALVILRERAHVVRLSIPDFATALIAAVAAGPPPGDATPEW